MLRKGIKLYGFQKRGVEFIGKAKACILGDEMGLGKTIQAIAFADLHGLKTLVVCPAYLIQNWNLEIERFLSRTGADFTVVSYDRLKKESAKYFKKFDFVVADESQYLKNLEAKRTQTFHTMFNHYPPKYFVALSGTPIKNRVVEFYSPLKLISMHPSKSNGKRLTQYFKSESSFCDYFSNFRQFEVNGIPIKRYYGLKNPDELKLLLKGKYLRRKADKILDLPKLIEKTVSFPSEELEELDEQLKIDFEYGATHMATSKARSAEAKAKFTAKYALDIIEQTGSVVVFTDHVKSAEEIFFQINKKFPSRLILGSTQTLKRSQFVADFQAGRSKALVCSIGAAGVGFTMTKANHMVFNDLSWVPGDNAQALKRIHRIGQTKRCCIHYIVGSDMDATITKTLKSKEKELKAVL